MDRIRKATPSTIAVPRNSERNLRRLEAVERRHRAWAWGSGCLRIAGGGTFAFAMSLGFVSLMGQHELSSTALYVVCGITAFWSLLAWYRPSLCVGGFQFGLFFVAFIGACLAVLATALFPIVEAVVQFFCWLTGKPDADKKAQPKSSAAISIGTINWDRQVSRRIDLIHAIKRLRAELAAGKA